MTSFEPVVVLFGSSKNISAINFRLPVAFVLATDVGLLEELITIDPELSDTCLQRYFVILLETVKNDVLERLQTNHRVQVIYTRESLMSTSNHSKLYRTINKQSKKFTLDLTTDIVEFLTIEGEKQGKLERLDLTRIYYRQARLLKEWAMSFIKAEPCHILIIPLNTNQENLINAQERLQKLCTKLNYSSVIIRSLSDYIPSFDENKSYLLPYSEILFTHEHPQYICELIKKLSPLRLYLYGNEEYISNDWSNLMINRELNLMDDEDNWCAFIENEYIDDEMKWNIGPMFGEKWKIKRIAPINLTELDKNLRFQSALHRACKTFNHRQIEITSEIFDWYDKCLQEGYLQLEPKLTYQQIDKKDGIRYSAVENQISNFKGISFIWLDEILNSSNNYLNDIIKPHEWNFFNNIPQCLSFIENQLHEQNKIFLITSGSLGYDLFLTSYRLMSTIEFIYIYCSKLDLHGNWIKYYSQIQGVFNDVFTLGEKIKQDLENIYQLSIKKKLRPSVRPLIYGLEADFDLTMSSIPIIVYNQEQSHALISHQRTIDTLLDLPHTNESRYEMIEEFRRIYSNNITALVDIDIFEQTYNSNSAIQWYTRDTFLFRIINKALRSSDIDMMFKIRYFLTDLYVQINDLYKQNQNLYNQTIDEKLYRGQLMSKNEFDYFQQIKGDIISINTFLSTTTSLQIALSFTNSLINNTGIIPIVFCIETNCHIQHKRPYANISNFSMYTDEDEVLFAMGSLFRIQDIQRLDNIPIIYLQMIDQNQIDS